MNYLLLNKKRKKICFQPNAWKLTTKPCPEIGDVLAGFIEQIVPNILNEDAVDVPLRKSVDVLFRFKMRFAIDGKYTETGSTFWNEFPANYVENFLKYILAHEVVSPALRIDISNDSEALHWIDDIDLEHNLNQFLDRNQWNYLSRHYKKYKTKILCDACGSCSKKKPETNVIEHVPISTTGYLYGISNASLPGLIRVGATTSLQQTMTEANSSWKLPYPYILAIEKRVENPEQKLQSLLVSLAENCVNHSEHVQITLGELQDRFASIEDLSVSAKRNRFTMRECFANDQPIRHTIGEHVWAGRYDKESNTIQFGPNTYKSPSSFAKAHYAAVGPQRVSANGWNECEFEKGGTWTYLRNYGT